MKTLTIAGLSALVSLGIGLECGHKIAAAQYQPRIKEINQLRSELARFHNKKVFDHAVRVSQITGAPLYQVLTGSKE